MTEETPERRKTSEPVETERRQSPHDYAEERARWAYYQSVLIVWVAILVVVVILAYAVVAGQVGLLFGLIGFAAGLLGLPAAKLVDAFRQNGKP